MRVSTSIILVSCLAISFISAWPSKNANRNSATSQVQTEEDLLIDDYLPIDAETVDIESHLDFDRKKGSKSKKKAGKKSGKKSGKKTSKKSKKKSGKKNKKKAEKKSGKAAYCAMDSGHTMCLYDGVSADVADRMQYRTIDAVGKAAILDKLNTRRNEVAGGEVAGQPTATNMKKLEWNDELETIAQRWADQGNTGDNTHDKTRGLLDGSSVGQNAFVGNYYRQDDSYYDYGYDYRIEEDQDRKMNWVYGSIDHMDEQTQSDIMEHLGEWTEGWFNEVKDFSKDNINPFVYADAYGHYSQDLWAETNEVGCGFVFFTSAEAEQTLGTDFIKYTALMLCNFSPAGNMIGGEMYKEGPPASGCDTGYSKDATYSNLCSKN